ncbi:MAG TPA: hypothetical protein VF242_04005 [Nitrososphaeraceae archaeon]
MTYSGSTLWISPKSASSIPLASFFIVSFQGISLELTIIHIQNSI